MDNCWQRKCGSMWQSTSPPLVSSSLPDSHSQFPNAGQNFCSSIPQDSVSLGNGIVQQSTLPWTSNSIVDNSSPAEFSGSFISFLSDPLPSLQGEFQQSSNLKSVFTLNEKPINRNNANGSASTNGPVLVPAVELSQYFSSHKLKAGDTLKSTVVINHPRHEMAKQTAPSHYVGNEKLKHFFPRGASDAESIPNSAMKFNDIPDILTSRKVFLETGSSGQLSPALSSYPRVFCLGLSGYLVLRNTGLLGVICLCHSSHMSVSRFCEHSGLSDVNPGNAVRMDSGVTIAHWRKVFFQELGIRAPDDHGGWDWPEVFPVSTGLREFYPSLPNLSPNAEQSRAFGASSGAGQSWNNMFISKNPQRPTLSNLDGIRDPQNGSSFISAYIGSNSKDTNTFNSLPDLKFSKPLGINSSLMQMDGSSISSSIELRLGHPSQQSKKFGTSAQQSFEYHPTVKPMEYQQSLFPETLMHKVESRPVKESRSNFHVLNLSPRSGKGQLDLVNSAYGLHNATGESRTRDSIFPMLQARFKDPSEGIPYSEAAKNMVNISHIPPGEPQCKSLTLKCDQTDFHCARGNMTNKEFKVDTSCAFGHGYSDKGVANNIANLHGATELNFGFYSKYYENKTTVKRVVEGIGHSNCLALHEKNLYSCKPYGMMMDMPDAQNTLNLYGKTSLISHNGTFDNGSIRSVCKSMDSRAAPPSQAVTLGFPLSSSNLIGNRTLQSSSRESLNGRPIELTENPKMQTLHQGLEFPTPVPVSSSTTATKEHVLCRNPFGKAPTSINQVYEPNVANTPLASKTAAVSAFPGVSDYMGKHSQLIAPNTDLLEGCNFSALSHGGSLHAQDKELHCQLSTDYTAVHWPYLRCGDSESNNTPSVEQAKCFQVVPDSFMSYRCSCAVQPDTSLEKHRFICEPPHTTQIEERGISGCIRKNLFACKLNDSQKFPLENVASLEQNSNLMGHKINKMECHSSQWRDVPQKVTGAVSLTCKEQTTSFLNVNEKLRGQSADAGGKIPNCDVAFQNVECLKEPEMSNVSSGGSTPLVTEVSAVIHDKYFSSADGQNTTASNAVVDEGSGIDRCWSSNDVQCSEQSAEFFGVVCEFNPIDAGSSKRFADNCSRSLIDELRLRDSLRLNKMQSHSSFSIQEKSRSIQKMADISNKVIRKRTKWRKLDTTFPAVYSACGYPEGTCGAGLQCHSCKYKKNALPSDDGSAEECAYSIEPSFRERRFRMRSLNTLSCNSKVKCHEAKTIGTQSDLLKVGDDDTFVTCELPRRKRPKLDTATPVRQIDGEVNLGDEAVAKCSLVDTSMSSEMHEKISRREVRPIVCGKYGVISNGNPSKPVKFVSLREICDSLAKCSFSGNYTAKVTYVKFRKASTKGKHQCMNKSCNLKKVGSCNAHRVVTAKKSKSHLLTSGELDHCHGGELGAGLFYSLEKRRYDCLVKTGNIADDSLPTQQKPKSKEIHKRGLYESKLEGIHPGEGGSTCARTEGYKGRKKEGVRYNFPQYSESGGGCLVAQEQLNAWIHITGQKRSRKEVSRLPPKDAEYDYRKEYARYKHSKGWKSLVVYKSGIHALGLYTSRFISQSEMVVEYVGEIVGLRVADKREIDYLSGKKLQYKSACYFFRIDQEHIVDATQKGGIARFVNHSCMPNCVARIISVRNEKKVVFFAERDIYPGEEITYDYNFNHEDEGKKIPCYCNSKNCRQYLN
ncbi:PREDICTED: uncharacterized protein LOC109233498 isoform X2 [Nicotiana attenuata]|uniref:uncharacterized protein LOC109233498 isoform X2 n=1 Tax=Nicotiana attenuata TaxID=49451 RepID=UPI0009052DB1|nr:PREDICTED: uncharacterized protein LOC109233498 isoform X2 [Nicotiana attenuata]